MGLIHARGALAVVRDCLDDPLTLALAQDAITETRLTPSRRLSAFNQVRADQGLAHRRQFATASWARPWD
jgi:hypothetical protein